MPIRYEKRITRQMLRDEPESLFLFGDNLLRKGMGGQAKEMRGEPNAVGIPTKREPSMRESAFFTDDDVFEFMRHSNGAFHQLFQHVQHGGTIIIPSDGIGTGLADLERRAPKIWDQLQRTLRMIKGASPIGRTGA